MVKVNIKMTRFENFSTVENIKGKGSKYGRKELQLRRPKI